MIAGHKVGTSDQPASPSIKPPSNQLTIQIIILNFYIPGLSTLHFLAIANKPPPSL